HARILVGLARLPRRDTTDTEVAERIQAEDLRAEELNGDPLEGSIGLSLIVHHRLEMLDRAALDHLTAPTLGPRVQHVAIEEPGCDGSCHVGFAQAVQGLNMARWMAEAGLITISASLPAHLACETCTGHRIKDDAGLIGRCTLADIERLRQTPA